MEFHLNPLPARLLRTCIYQAMLDEFNMLTTKPTNTAELQVTLMLHKTVRKSVQSFRERLVPT